MKRWLAQLSPDKVLSLDPWCSSGHNQVSGKVLGSSDDDEEDNDDDDDNDDMDADYVNVDGNAVTQEHFKRRKKHFLFNNEVKLF